MTAWREYHEATKHSAESLKRTYHVLDWANMPDPYRHYEGVPILDLPGDPPAPGVGETSCHGPVFLSQLLFYSAAISASKRVPSTGSKYALRVNPSSGNLHPTELHFLTQGLEGWPDGLYHYRPSSHTAEQRARGRLDLKEAGSSSVVFVLTSIAWREAWKYRERAYRYCLHDVGHAWQSLALAARAMGCETSATGEFADDELAQLMRLNTDEWPMLIIKLDGPSRAAQDSMVWFGGRANQLSTETITYPRIEAIHAATKAFHSGPGWGGLELPCPAPSERAFGEVVRGRRSALDFVGGGRSMSPSQFSAILAAAGQTRYIQLYLYAHRIEGLEPGVYRLGPDSVQLELVRSGDQRVAAAGLSLGQDLAGNACVAFSMIGDLVRGTREHGDRGYRYVHFEAGAIGQRLYLAAEAHGLRATGIGAFFDDQVHRYLNLKPEQGQVVYHFAIGYPVHDPRLDA